MPSTSPRHCAHRASAPAWMLVPDRIAGPRPAWIQASAPAPSIGARFRGRDAVVVPVQLRREAQPVEARTRVELATGCDMLMSDDVADRTDAVDRRQQPDARVVLRGLEGVALEA